MFQSELYFTEMKSPLGQIKSLLRVVESYNPEIAAWYSESIKESQALGLDISPHLDDLYEILDSVVGGRSN